MKPLCEADKVVIGGVTTPLDAWFGHCLVTGFTGTGKTTLLLKIITQLVARHAQVQEEKAAAVILDVKGDLLEPVRAILRKCGREQDLVVLGPGTDNAWWNPLADPSLNPGQMVQSFTTAASIQGQAAGQTARADELFWTTNRNELLAAICELAQKTAQQSDCGPLRISHVLRLSRLLIQRASSWPKMIEEITPMLSDSAAATFASFARLPENTSACVSASVEGVLAQFGREPLRSVLDGESHRFAVDIRRDLFARGKIIVVNSAHAEQGMECLPAQVWFKTALFSLILSRPRLPHEEQTRPIWIVLDEFTRTVLAHESGGVGCEHVAMEMARSSRAGFILAAQNLSGLVAIAGETLVTKIAALCRTLVFFGNSCAWTSRLATQVFGREWVHRKHITVASYPPPPFLFPEPQPLDDTDCPYVLVPSLEPVVSPERLAQFRTGEAVVKLPDGSVHQLHPDPRLGS
jgi:type IV secretory pathway TraG/TraD family ATPase VirD4